MAILTPEEFQQRLKQFEKELNTSAIRNRISRQIIRIIFERTKRGQGVTNDSGPSDTIRNKRLKRLSPAYVSFRRGTVRFTTKAGERVQFRVRKPSLGKFGSAGRSNLTLTGQMLDSIQSRVSRNAIRVFIPNTPRSDSELSNAEIAKEVSKDRPFFAISKSEARILAQVYDDYVKGLVKKFFS